MDSKVIAESRRLVESGVASQNEFRFDDAALSFWRALAGLERETDQKARRDEARRLAALFLKAGHEDLGLLAVRAATRLDAALKNHKALASDLILYGNVHVRLGNIEEAAGSFREVIDLCLARGDFADAASASTNLAGILAQNGKPEEAIGLLTKSLEYVAREPFPDTEFNTLAMLIQVVGVFGGDPALAVESAIAIGKKFPGRLTEEHRKLLVPHVEKAVPSYLEDHPQPNAEAWKRQNLSWLDRPSP